MKRWLAMICVLCCLALSGCAGAEKKGWAQEEWENVIMALASDDEEPVRKAAG
jgi:hypothetical protein